MRLKRLVARGFKSFADRTEFEFDTRLTGIIGPNGCGKSNVVDAIKWVLGDQRAKSLRGTEMTDVIFKGAEGREAMGMAEVTITFEDPNGRLEGRQEIDISRRLTLDKESSYLLNGSEVRLKDVRDVLLDTGLGTGGYSVMEQGRIDAVLSANPEARRAIFEEAAGVSRFKLQKREALRKLERTDQNLARVTDLLEERSRRIRSLRIQAGKARRWHELQAALRDLRAALAVIDGTELRSQLATHDARLQDLQATMVAADEGRRTAADELAVADAAIAVCAEALEEVQEELRECQEELTTHRERAQAQQHRAGDRQDELERGRQRSAGLADQCSERTMQLTLLRDDLVQRETALIEMHKALETQQKATQASIAGVRSLHAEREVLRERQLDLLHRRTRLRNVAADAHAKIAAAKTREQRLGERRNALGVEQQRLVDEGGKWQVDLADHDTRERILLERERAALADLEGADAAAAALATNESELRHELSQVEGQRAALLAMEAHMEGFDEGPRHVLQQQPPGLRGRLLDLIEIDVEHGAALEAALGPFVQALVVDTREHAAAIVRELTEKRIGRVLLLVEEAFGDEPPCAMTMLPAPAGVNRLASLVRHVARDADSLESGASHKLLGWLLRGVVVADFDIADSARADLCFVTPDGTLVCGPRMEGGLAVEGHGGLVVRKSRIGQLGDEAMAVQQRLSSLQAGKDVATGRVDRLKRELKALGEALLGVRRERQTVEAQQARIAARDLDVQRELGELALESADLSFARCAGTARLGPALFDQFLLARGEKVAAAAEEELDARIHAAEASTQAQQRAEQDLRIRQVQAGESREGLVRGIKMHEEAVRDFERALQELHDRQHDAEADCNRALAEHARLSALADDLEVQRAQLDEQKQQCQGAVDESRQRQKDVSHRVQEWDHRRSAAADALTQSRLAIADVDHRFARLEERLREDTGVELRRCLGEVHGIGHEDPDRFEGPPAPLDAVEQLLGPRLPPSVVEAFHGLQQLWLQPTFDVVETRKEVQVLQSQKDRLGAVNLDAVKELDTEEGQFTTLEQEVGDLKEARRSLMETLKKLEAESKTLFETTFHEARKNFQEIFRKLFQGGKADMFLSFEAAGGGGAGEDLLEAGIEIVAQPPGKQLQSINLLSGGERSLTAVAILFALFKVRPSPFCILDEVDAALDETNVERFLRVLRDFTHDTQFCIVTHHKRTMAECQVLYGITMQRRGVSSRIAVSLQEVDSFQDGAVAPETPGKSKDPALKQRIAGEEKVGFA